MHLQIFVNNQFWHIWFFVFEEWMVQSFTWEKENKLFCCVFVCMLLCVCFFVMHRVFCIVMSDVNSYFRNCSALIKTILFVGGFNAHKNHEQKRSKEKQWCVPAREEWKLSSILFGQTHRLLSYGKFVRNMDRCSVLITRYEQEHVWDKRVRRKTINSIRFEGYDWATKNSEVCHIRNEAT